VPADHAYPLLAGIASVVPAVHGHTGVGIFPLRGRLGGARDLLLMDRTVLTLRAPVEFVRELLPLAGKVLTVGGCRLRVGTPTVRALMPAASLFSRLVIIKHGVDADSFLVRARQQLADLGVAGTVELVRRRADQPLQAGVGSREPWVRRTIRVQQHTIVGYAVLVNGLSVDGSLQLQAAGLGGKRRLGAGLFVPVRERAA